MSKKRHTYKKTSAQRRTGPPRKSPKYSATEVAMAVLGAAILIMIAGIIITALLG